VSRYRRDERVRRRRRLLTDELAKLRTIRHRIEDSPDAATAQNVLREADDLLLGAEEDAAVDLLDAESIQALRSLHRVCGRIAERRIATLMAAPLPLPSVVPPVPASVTPIEPTRSA
jgi:hypothetical protein